ncbi:hypothetical protein [Kribbella sp. CA-294648]|uniref:hypothetical protein n=1 Tax=Kribbella sp. CA-294648 TaxID=3239948 RepID=UPI003D92C55E
MSSFAEQVAAALDTHDAQDAAHRVHEVVRAELKSLDQSASVDLTGYFNHSYVPDVVVSWKDGSRVVERPLFLRHSLRSSRASGDLERFDRLDQTAFFLSLSQDEPADDTRILRDVAAERNDSRVLVTTVPALDELTSEPDVIDPVLGLVRASVVRSARGAVVEDDIEKLVLPRERRIEPADLEAFSTTVASAFTEDAVLRINRVFGIVEQALAEEPDVEALMTSGALSPAEMRELIPYLLRLEGVTQNRDFWLSVASLIDLQEIERLWRTFSDLDMTPLASAGSSLWQAKRLQLSLRAEAIDDEDYDGSPRWSVAGNLLAAEVGEWRLTFAHQPTKLKFKGRDALPARWEDLRPKLESYTVTDADLSGIVTKSQYGARESVDMKRRIEAFIESADDSFHVPSVTVLVGAGDQAADVTADFSEMMLSANPSADLATLIRVAVNILGYRRPTEEADLQVLLGRSKPDRADGN